MRTTVNIHDGILERAREMAKERHCSLGAVFEEALRILTYKRTDRKLHKPIELITFSGRGTQPGVDLDSNASLLDIMEDR